MNQANYHTRSILIILLMFCTSVIAKGEKQVYGLSEYAYVPMLKEFMSAKMDTGAKTSSISAKNIKIYRKEGQLRAEFTILNKDEPSYVIDKPVVRYSNIKLRSGEFNKAGKSHTKRAVVTLKICLSGTVEKIEFNLVDRSSFRHPLLIGSDALKKFNAIVDPSLKFTHSKSKKDCK